MSEWTAFTWERVRRSVEAAREADGADHPEAVALILRSLIERLESYPAIKVEEASR